VAHAQDQHAIGLDPVADDVGTRKRRLAQLRPWHPATAMREGGETVAGLDDALGHVARGIGIEISDVAADALNVGQGRKSPDDRRQRFGMGQGSSSGVPQERSHFTTSSCGTSRPAATSASASAIARASASVSISKMVLVFAFAIKFTMDNLYIITRLAYRKANAFATWRKLCASR